MDAEIARLRDIEMREREEHIRMKQAALEAREKELMNSSQGGSSTKSVTVTPGKNPKDPKKGDPKKNTAACCKV